MVQRWANITNGPGVLNADCLHGGHVGEVADCQGASRSRPTVTESRTCLTS